MAIAGGVETVRSSSPSITLSSNNSSIFRAENPVLLLLSIRQVTAYPAVRMARASRTVWTISGRSPRHWRGGYWTSTCEKRIRNCSGADPVPSMTSTATPCRRLRPAVIDPAYPGRCHGSAASPVLLRWMWRPRGNWSTSARRVAKSWVAARRSTINSGSISATLVHPRWMMLFQPSCPTAKTLRRVSRRRRIVRSRGRAVANTSVLTVAEERHLLRRRTHPALAPIRPTLCSSASSWRTDPTARKRRVHSRRVESRLHRLFRLPSYPTYRWNQPRRRALTVTANSGAFPVSSGRISTRFRRWDYFAFLSSFGNLT